MKTRRGKYIYSPLNTTSRTIRLLRVLPEPGGTTHISLEEAHLDEIKGEYDAISYAWGHPSPCRHVVVDGKKLQIRDNMYQCLKHLRQHQMISKPLWIDCICINQADIVEKEQQIAYMSSIFSSARTIYVWLGRTSRFFQPEQNLGHALLRSALQPTLQAQLIETILHQQDPISFAATDQLMRLVYDEYWHRLWIVQEIALAQDVRVVMGNMLIDAEALGAVYFNIRDASKPTYYAWLRRQNDASFEDRGTAILDAHPILGVRTDSDELKRVSLAELIKPNRIKLCTEPRDRIYGLLGLTDSEHCPPIDYRCSVEVLLLRTLKCLIAESEDACSQEFDNASGSTEMFDPWLVACVMQSLEITAERVLSAIARSSTLAQEYAQHFEVTFQAFEVILPCSCVPEDQLTMEQQCTSIQTPLGQVEHFWKHWLWFGPKIEKCFQVNETGVPLLVCSIGSQPALLLSIDTDQQVHVERLLCFDLSRTVHQPVHYKSRDMPPSFSRALDTRLNMLKTNWQDVLNGKFFRMSVPFSGLELVELGETWDMDSLRYNPRDRDIDWRMTYSIRG